MYNPCTTAKVGYWAPVGIRWADVYSKAVSPTIRGLGQPTLTTAADLLEPVSVTQKTGFMFSPSMETREEWLEDARYQAWKRKEELEALGQTVSTQKYNELVGFYHTIRWNNELAKAEEEYIRLEKEAYGATMATGERERLEAEFAAERQRLEEQYSGYAPPGGAERAILEPTKTPWLLILGGAGVAYFIFRKK